MISFIEQGRLPKKMETRGKAREVLGTCSMYDLVLQVPVVRSIAVNVLGKRSTGLEDGLYGEVVVCWILISENNSLHKLFTNSLPLSECS